MKQIPLTKGCVALVDDDDFEEINKYKWYIDGSGYAVRKPHGQNPIYMHRVIANTPPNFETDHINGLKRDNRKKNLRTCTKSENMRNRGKPKHNKSGFKGVFWSIPAGRWKAQIRINKRAIHLGLFDKAIEAALAYNKAASKYFGDFAKLNVVE